VKSLNEWQNYRNIVFVFLYWHPSQAHRSWSLTTSLIYDLTFAFTLISARPCSSLSVFFALDSRRSERILSNVSGDFWRGIFRDLSIQIPVGNKSQQLNIRSYIYRISAVPRNKNKALSLKYLVSLYHFVIILFYSLLSYLSASKTFDALGFLANQCKA